MNELDKLEPSSLIVGEGYATHYESDPTAQLDMCLDGTLKETETEADHETPGVLTFKQT